MTKRFGSSASRMLTVRVSSGKSRISKGSIATAARNAGPDPSGLLNSETQQDTSQAPECLFSTVNDAETVEPLGPASSIDRVSSERPSLAELFGSGSGSRYLNRSS